MLNETKTFISSLEADELKSMLHFIHLNMQLVDEEEDYTEKQFYLQTKKLFDSFQETKQQRTNSKQIHTTHIVFGDSAGGCLKAGLKESNLIEEENIINMSDLFSIGPISQLHTSEGINARFNWLRSHISMDEESLFTYESNFQNYINLIHQIPAHHKIIIWAGDNAHEQTALAFVLYLLKEKQNSISIININEGFKKIDTRYTVDFTPRYMGELSAEQLMKMHGDLTNKQQLSLGERQNYEQYWLQLSASNDVLRIFENGQIVNVLETFYDDFIINTVRKFSKNTPAFIKTARVVGEVIGHIEQHIGDRFIEYRIIRLIMSGVFDMEGVPTEMRYYSIKLRA